MRPTELESTGRKFHTFIQSTFMSYLDHLVFYGVKGAFIKH